MWSSKSVLWSSTVVFLFGPKLIWPVSWWGCCNSWRLAWTMMTSSMDHLYLEDTGSQGCAREGYTHWQKESKQEWLVTRKQPRTISKREVCPIESSGCRTEFQTGWRGAGPFYFFTLLFSVSRLVVHTYSMFTFISLFYLNFLYK